MKNETETNADHPKCGKCGGSGEDVKNMMLDTLSSILTVLRSLLLTVILMAVSAFIFLFMRMP